MWAQLWTQFLRALFYSDPEPVGSCKPARGKFAEGDKEKEQQLNQTKKCKKKV